MVSNNNIKYILTCDICGVTRLPRLALTGLGHTGHCASFSK